MTTISKCDAWPKLLLAPPQNVARLRGRQFLYHLRHPDHGRLTLCGRTLARHLTYVEAHEARGAALLCSQCRRMT